MTKGPRLSEWHQAKPQYKGDTGLFFYPPASSSTFSPNLDSLRQISALTTHYLCSPLPKMQPVSTLKPMLTAINNFFEKSNVVSNEFDLLSYEHTIDATIPLDLLPKPTLIHPSQPAFPIHPLQLLQPERSHLIDLRSGKRHRRRRKLGDEHLSRRSTRRSHLHRRRLRLRGRGGR